MCEGDLKEREKQITSSTIISSQVKEFKMSSFDETLRSERNGYDLYRHKDRTAKIFPSEKSRFGFYFLPLGVSYVPCACACVSVSAHAQCAEVKTAHSEMHRPKGVF